MEVIGLLVQDGRVSGAAVRDRVTAKTGEFHAEFCNMVINRMHKSGDGDMVVPQRGLSIVGTTSWVVEESR